MFFEIRIDLSAKIAFSLSAYEFATAGPDWIPTPNRADGLWPFMLRSLTSCPRSHLKSQLHQRLLPPHHWRRCRRLMFLGIALDDLPVRLCFAYPKFHRPLYLMSRESEFQHINEINLQLRRRHRIIMEQLKLFANSPQA